MPVEPSTTVDNVADYIDDVRTLLQDTIQPFRYTDVQLLKALNLTLMEMYRVRPDMFFGVPGFGRAHQIMPEYQVPASGNASDSSDTVPIEPQFRLAFIHGIAAHALERDQEDVQDARASQFMGVFTQMLVGGVNPAASIRPPPGAR